MSNNYVDEMHISTNCHLFTTFIGGDGIMFLIKKLQFRIIFYPKLTSIKSN